VVDNYWFIKPLHGIRAIRLTSIRSYGLRKLFFYSFLQHHGSHGYYQAILHPFSFGAVKWFLCCNAQNFMKYVDGSTPMPSAAVDPTSHNLWKQFDQLVMILLLSSLIKEAFFITICLTTSRDV